jgi:hypothetical protein
VRYYAIVIQDANGNAPPNFPAIQGADVAGANFCSFINGQTDPCALNIEIDAPQGPFHVAVGGTMVRIWGISLQQISQVSSLNQANSPFSIKVYGGMRAGLPLANPQQSGLIIQGSILNAFANWIGTDMTLDLTIAPQLGSANEAGYKNIVHNWQANTPLSRALQQTLTTAFPGFTPKINISPNLVLPYNDNGFYQTLEQFSNYLFQVSRDVVKTSGYSGVRISQNGNSIVVSDGTQSNMSNKQINFQDLIGQPTWIGLNTVSVKTVMRADIDISDVVTLPNSLVTTTAASAPQYRSQTSFQGKFMVQEIRHVGNFRQPDAASWNTTFNMATVSQ